MPLASLTAELAGGGICIRGTGLALVRLESLRPEVKFRQGRRKDVWRPDLVPAGAGFDSQPSPLGLAVRVEVRESGHALVIAATLTNNGSAPLDLESVAPLAMDAGGMCEIGSGADRWSVFRQGYQSWTGTRSFRAGEIDFDPISPPLRVALIDVARPSPAHPGHFRSDMFTLIGNLRSGEAVVVGFTRAAEAFSDVEVRIDGDRCVRLAPAAHYDGIALRPGESLSLPPLYIAAGFDHHAVLDAYLGAAAEVMRARVPDRRPLGWCSWYYYFTGVSEAGVIENVERLAAERHRFPCDFVQVDDGYQSAIGDWLAPNEKFPHGMAWLAERIRSAGFDAGIWTAPFIARRGSRLLAEHPDWFVRDRRGRPRFALWNPAWGAGGVCYALDTTHPEALDWLRHTFRVIAGEWGYRVLKLDFLYAAALPGTRHDPRATRAAALRRGLDAIREAAGDEAFLLGCGCPLGPAVGVVDAMRIGPDVAPFWTNWLSRVPQRGLHGLAAKHAVRNTLTRAVLHRRWWLNDPDCLMVRDRDTRLTEDEVRTLATVIAVTDGMIVVSDRLDGLSPPRLELLARTLDLAGGVEGRGEGAGAGRRRLADAMERDIPELAVFPLAGSAAVAVFNFDDRPKRREIDLGALGLADATSGREWWSGTAVPVRGGRADLGEIPAHGCRVLVLP